MNITQIMYSDYYNETFFFSTVVLDLADREGATDIVGLFHLADLGSVVDSMENVTFFLPTNDAIAVGIKYTYIHVASANTHY
jgi:hypothetical protein